MKFCDSGRQRNPRRLRTGSEILPVKKMLAKRETIFDTFLCGGFTCEKSLQLGPPQGYYLVILSQSHVGNDEQHHLRRRMMQRGLLRFMALASLALLAMTSSANSATILIFG